MLSLLVQRVSCFLLVFVLVSRGEANAAPADAPLASEACVEVAPTSPQLLLPELVHPPRRAIWSAPDGGGRDFLVPIVEMAALHGIFWGTAKVLGKPYADISLETMRRNLTDGWVWDEDAFATNAFGHPYQGSLAYTAARSNGFGFWGSVPFTVASSVLWELFMESESPSTNDLITTSIGGVVLGEVLHRTALAILDEGEPTLARSVISLLVEPVGGINRFLFGRRKNDFFPVPGSFLQGMAGVTSNVDNYNDIDGTRFDVPNQLEGHLGVEVVYGPPQLTSGDYDQPFDYFTLTARMGFSRDTLTVGFFSRGLLYGDRFQFRSVSGLWGLMAGYDFANPNTLRVSTVSLGIGGVAQVPLTSQLTLDSTATVAGVPFGHGGGLTSPESARDYHFGPGAQSAFELGLVRRGVGRVGVSVRNYLISGAFLGEGVELITYATARAELLLAGQHGVALEAFVANRAGQFGIGSDTLRQRATQIRLLWTFSKGPGFGTR
ncbi:DUF3943 domain-containing protein [Corallococcus macrosporus]|uniref:DUF3943 domain-containing protein n=1 Tax=Corallococcus macrosporus DSM 14697 TaxID=1189310 RepID=A0A250K2C9_9BACT|nr:DUF3943 domain-containing protein [Corallococcus macrosporus]ATB49506.1 hypothetical protein MYMAC_005151 [Corallococcus macrosporus DSM 14697]